MRIILDIRYAIRGRHHSSACTLENLRRFCLSSGINYNNSFHSTQSYFSLYGEADWVHDCIDIVEKVQGLKRLIIITIKCQTWSKSINSHQDCSVSSKRGSFVSSKDCSFFTIISEVTRALVCTVACTSCCTFLVVHRTVLYTCRTLRCCLW